MSSVIVEKNSVSIKSRITCNRKEKRYLNEKLNLNQEYCFNVQEILNLLPKTVDEYKLKIIPVNSGKGWVIDYSKDNESLIAFKSENLIDSGLKMLYWIIEFTENNKFDHTKYFIRDSKMISIQIYESLRHK